MSSKMAIVEEYNSCPSWFETANIVSALAMPLNSGQRQRTSCSAGRSAGLDSFALSLSQPKDALYYRKWRLEGGGFFFSKKGSLAGAVTDAPGVLPDFSSRNVDLGIFEINYYVVGTL